MSHNVIQVFEHKDKIKGLTDKSEIVIYEDGIWQTEKEIEGIKRHHEQLERQRKDKLREESLSKVTNIDEFVQGYVDRDFYCGTTGYDEKLKELGLNEGEFANLCNAKREEEYNK